MINFDEDSPTGKEMVKEFRRKKELKKINDFENMCKKYTTDEIKHRQKMMFFRRMTRNYFDVGDVIWTDNEKEWKLEMLMNYFPEFKKELDEYGLKTEDSRKRKAEKKLKEKPVEINPKYKMQSNEDTLTK